MSDAQPDERLAALQHVCSALEQMRLIYVIGGSMVSSLYGQMRFTNDADLVVEMFAGRETEFQSYFGDEYYVSLSAMQEANRDRRSFNIIYIPMAFKIDVFVSKDRAFDREAMLRRIPGTLVGHDKSLPVLTVEDTILSKLEWYRAGDEVSEQQWKDVAHMLRKQDAHLEKDYLRRWAKELRVDDLLKRAEEQTRSALDG